MADKPPDKSDKPADKPKETPAEKKRAFKTNIWLSVLAIILIFILVYLFAPSSPKSANQAEAGAQQQTPGRLTSGEADISKESWKTFIVGSDECLDVKPVTEGMELDIAPGDGSHHYVAYPNGYKPGSKLTLAPSNLFKYRIKNGPSKGKVVFAYHKKSEPHVF